MEKPTFKQRINSFGKFVWNSDTGEFLGRGGRSWAEIGLFYLIYYACLAGFFTATIAVFYQTIDADHPKLQGDDSLLKGNPGMGFQPMPDIDTTLIYARKVKKVSDAYVKSIDKVLEPYRKSDLDNVNCATLNKTRPGESVACAVNFTALTKDCNQANAYGMSEGKPCVLLKLNKIYGWTPEVWSKEEAQESKKIPKDMKDKYDPTLVNIYCHGENPADEDNLGKEDITYAPQQGFPLYFYPYEKQKDYLSPLVFVKFNKATHHLALMVECKVLAKNIVVDRTEKEGSVHFELLVEP